jgi:hypothetical protein
LLLVLLVGCEPFSSPAVAVTTPPPPVVVTPPPVIENHVTFVTIAPPPVEAPAPPVEAPTPVDPPQVTVAAPPPVSRPRPPYCTCMENARLTAQQPVHPTTTVPACDRYLTRAEVSVRCSTDDAGAIKRVMLSLDLSWRQWRDVAGGPGRKYLVDSCDVAEKEMDSALEDACR